MTVYWEVLPERNGAAYYESYSTILDVVEYTARLQGYNRLRVPPTATAHARNAACQFFYETAKDDNDTLVMLDADHKLPRDVVRKLAEHDKGVVGALAAMRGDIPFLNFFVRNDKGEIQNLTKWKDGELVEGMILATCGIAIKKWVLKKLSYCAPSWFRYIYTGSTFEPSEEMYFGYECARQGIPHYCDTSIYLPHCQVNDVTPDDWREFYKQYPDVKRQIRHNEFNAFLYDTSSILPKD